MSVSTFTHFKGKAYDSDMPPKAWIPNALTCQKFSDFVVNTLISRIKDGSLKVWGKVGEYIPPHLVMPLTVDPQNLGFAMMRGF
jgi:hypothetical protein